jgi:hypothetical protein
LVLRLEKDLQSQSEIMASHRPSRKSNQKLQTRTNDYGELQALGITLVFQQLA